MTPERRFPTIAPAGRPRALRAAVQAARGLSVLVPLVLAVLATGNGSLRWVFGACALGSAAVAWTYRRFLGDYARSLSVGSHGEAEVTDDHLIVCHEGVLAGDIAIPWWAVRAVCVDDGTSADEDPDQDHPAGSGARPGPALRFRVACPPAVDPGSGPDALFTSRGARRTRSGGIPLLASGPVVPNVLVVLEPPVEIPWHYPFIAGPFNPPRRTTWPIRPWPRPALTAAFFLAVADPPAFAAAAGACAPVRAARPDDARYLAAAGLIG